MASRRKSTTPCMVRASGAVESSVLVEWTAGKASGAPELDVGESLADSKDNCENDCEVIEGKSSPANPTKKPLGGYECKYCPFSTQNLNEFTEHIDTQHPNVILNPLYVCAECNFTTKKYDSLSEHNMKFHPGENNFKLKLIKLNNQTVLEQSIEVTNNSVVAETPESDGVAGGTGEANKGTQNLSIGKPKEEGKKPSVDNHLDGTSQSLPESTEPITCINGAELLQEILAHVMPSVQLPPNINLVPKVPVPLNSTKYNSALDTNATMINSFNKFPYPTQAELSWLTAASKHPEEQIRIWFAIQRLKHGISWSPEEVEEARKKMFNGTIQPTPQTIAVLPAPVATAKLPQPLIQTAVPCQILSQTGLVLTQVSNGSNVSPVTLAVAASQGQKRCAQHQVAAPEAKRQHVPTEVLPRQNLPSTLVNTTTGPPPPAVSNDRKKTKEQIAALKASFIVTQFPDDAEIYRLIEITGLSRSEIKKWFSDHRYRSQRGIFHITAESLAKEKVALSTSRQEHTYNPYPDFIFQQFKGKTQKQFGILEESFLKSSFPTQSELERLRAEARMSRREVESWFAERRKLRDNMEQVVLDSMGPSVKNKDQADANRAGSQTEKFSVSQATASLPKCSTTASSQEQVRLLKSMFVRTQWPSPQEYDELASQTGLTRTEIVRWFKENRSSLRMGTLKWLDQYQQQSIPDGYTEAKGLMPLELKNSRDEGQTPNKESQKLRKQSTDSSETSEHSRQNSHGSEEKPDAGSASWVQLTLEDEDAALGCMDSCSGTGPESKTGFDSPSISGDNSHT